MRSNALYARCRRQGITPRNPHDCQIACVAVEHGVPCFTTIVIPSTWRASSSG